MKLKTFFPEVPHKS